MMKVKSFIFLLSFLCIFQDMACAMDDFDEQFSRVTQRRFSEKALEELRGVYEHGRTMLDLDDEGIQSEEGIILAQSSILRTVKTFSLNDNEIGDRGAEAFAERSNVTWLCLNNNGIGDKGAGALSRSSTIEVLYLCGNSIGNVGARALAQNPMIKELYLMTNRITDEGANAFLDNTTLSILILGGNNIGRETARKLMNTGIFQVGLSKVKGGLSAQYINKIMRESNRDNLGRLIRQ